MLNAELHGKSISLLLLVVAIASCLLCTHRLSKANFKSAYLCANCVHTAAKRQICFCLLLFCLSGAAEWMNAVNGGITISEWLMVMFYEVYRLCMFLCVRQNYIFLLTQPLKGLTKVQNRRRTKSKWKLRLYVCVLFVQCRSQQCLERNQMFKRKQVWLCLGGFNTGNIG